jgi:branched-subunit amino acid aminotransferase/4-amino-4-deoxychorismate lyase
LDRLDRPIDAFDLLETLRWDPVDGYVLLDRHLKRLRDSAQYFGYPCRPDLIRDALAGAVVGAIAGSVAPQRVRLLVDRHGDVRVEAFPLEHTPVPLRVAFAAQPIDPADPFFLHKTTSRERYERHRLRTHDETVLWNPMREVTEAIAANIVVERDGQRLTPPVSCGLLPGTLRAELLAQGAIVEARVTVDDLVQAPRFWLINSVRGWREAVLDAPV